MFNPNILKNWQNSSKIRWIIQQLIRIDLKKNDLADSRFESLIDSVRYGTYNYRYLCSN